MTIALTNKTSLSSDSYVLHWRKQMVLCLGAKRPVSKTSRTRGEKSRGKHTNWRNAHNSSGDLNRKTYYQSARD